MKKAHPGFELKWNNLAYRPYFLNPELEGLPPVPKVQHLEQKLGKPLASMRSITQLQERGLTYGLHYRFEASDLASGTLDSHRLLCYAATAAGPEVAAAFRRELMRLYNEEGKALAAREVLLDAVSKVGLDVDVAEAVLDGGAYGLDVKWQDGQARKQGITMVPHYRFYTPLGTHSVSDFYDEWHFLDGIYRAFPTCPDASGWQAASRGVRAAVEAMDAWKALQRAERKGEASVDQVQEAEKKVAELQAKYRNTFLPDMTSA